ncbi:OmpA family protein [Oceanisphaera avium]|uniref:Flagellar motor protein MotB n=1 Tax=Oceanisphaera avium TaxID=1903694 RepID=A0A1Y0CUH3_9GAMM|nr:OmpA family protein [Oceanisphaera avium]ART78942.1 flagellar motor protein MotB [Oceanisphaera avium]
MKIWMMLALLLPLTACSLTSESFKETPAAYDLTDQDRDGVITARDNCLDSVANAEVDNDGCGDASTVTLNQDIIVLFAHDSAVISAQYQSEISHMANFMNDNPKLKLLLEGHASQVGTQEYNLALSKRRAEAVKNALIKAGVSEARLEVIGYGSTQPVLMAAGENAAAANRRVVGALATQQHSVGLRWNVYDMGQTKD